MSRFVLLSVSSIALSLLLACGGDSGPTEPVSEAPSADLPFHVRIDVHDNLLRFFDRTAARPAPRTREVHLDFLETARIRISDTEAEVAGQFLFSVDDGPVQRGRIDVRFAWRGDRWIRTGFTVTENAVDSQRITVRIRDGQTDEPVPGVVVEARRVDDDFLSSHRGITDEMGFVELEVFPGLFQVRTERSEYRSTQSDIIPVSDEETEVRLPLHKFDRALW